VGIVSDGPHPDDNLDEEIGRPEAQKAIQCELEYRDDVFSEPWDFFRVDGRCENLCGEVNGEAYEEDNVDDPSVALN